MKHLYLGLIALAPIYASAATLVVDADGEASSASCDSTLDTPYSSIGSALEDATSGDTVIVCPGEYAEQLVIPTMIKLEGRNGATIKPGAMQVNTESVFSGDDIAAVIAVGPAASGTTIEEITVDAAGNGIAGCAPDLIGIYFGNASGTVRNSVVKNVQLGTGLEGCQTGLAIYGETDDVGGQASITVTGTSVHDFQKNGITVNGLEASLTASGNTVTGLGPTPLIAQNGIQVGFGALATLTGNTVSDVFYTLCSVITDPGCANGSSSGILVFQPADGADISKNRIATSQLGIYLEGNGGLVRSNTISNTLVYDGIYLVGSSTRLTKNRITDSDESGIWIEGDSNMVDDNIINEAPIGVFMNGMGNLIELGGGNANQFRNIAENVVDGASRSSAAAVRPSMVQR